MADDLVTIAVFLTPNRADFARSVLEANGIRTFLRGDNLATVAPHIGLIDHGVQVQVAQEDADRARDVLQAESDLDAEELEALAEGPLVDDVPHPARMAPTQCPTCGSRAIEEVRPPHVVWVLMNTVFLGLPAISRALGLPKRLWTCRECGQDWRQ